MTDYIPPFPTPLKKRPGLFRRWFKASGCPLRSLTERNYRMKLGESNILGNRRYIVVEPRLVKPLP